MDDVEALDKLVHDLLGKYEAKNIQEALELAKKNEELDKELVYFMNKVYPDFQKKIIDKVEAFNHKYCANYAEVLKQVQKP